MIICGIELAASEARLVLLVPERKPPELRFSCHCEERSDEAISRKEGDCFVVRSSLLAMTARNQGFSFRH